MSIGEFDGFLDRYEVQETIYDDDLYWINQREADDYRYELDDQLDDVDDDEGWIDFPLQPEEDDFGDYGPGVDDFDPDNTWGVD